MFDLHSSTSHWKKAKQFTTQNHTTQQNFENSSISVCFHSLCISLCFLRKWRALVKRRGATCRQVGRSWLSNSMFSSASIVPMMPWSVATLDGRNPKPEKNLGNGPFVGGPCHLVGGFLFSFWCAFWEGTFFGVEMSFLFAGAGVLKGGHQETLPPGCSALRLLARAPGYSRS